MLERVRSKLGRALLLRHSLPVRQQLHDLLLAEPPFVRFCFQLVDGAD